jgi:hypothetical protein
VLSTGLKEVRLEFCKYGAILTFCVFLTAAAEMNKFYVTKADFYFIIIAVII